MFSEFEVTVWRQPDYCDWFCPTITWISYTELIGFDPTPAR